MTWNAALNHHSSDALAPLYAASVDFYGQPRTAEQVLAAKRQAFEKQPQFRQRVSGVSISQQGDDLRVSFQKLSGPELKNKTTGLLRLKTIDGQLKITEETDDVSDARFKPKADTCPEAALAVLDAEPAVNADHARVAREYPEVNPGGLGYNQDERTDHYSGSAGYFHEDHYEPRWWIEAADGELSIKDAYTTELLPLTPGQRALIKRVCAGKAE